MAFVPIYRTNDPKWRTADIGAGIFESSGFVNPSTGEYVGASDGYAIPTEYVDPSAGFTVAAGSPIRVNGSDQAVLPSAPYSTFRGVAIHPWVSGASPSSLVIDVAYTPLKQQLAAHHPVSRLVFRTVDINGVTPLNVHIGTTVKVALSGSLWGINVAQTTDGHFKITDIRSATNEYVGYFVDSAIQA